MADIISKTRLEALEKILPAVTTALQELMAAPVQKTTKLCLCKDATDDVKEQCQLQQLGSLVSGLCAAGLNPVPEVASYKGSVEELAKKLQGIKVAHYKLANTKPHLDTHSNCGSKHKEIISEALEKTVQLSGRLIQALKHRAEVSGAFSDDLFVSLKDMEKRDPSPEPKEDLRLNATYFKQVEDFATSPDYYSESYAGVVIKVEDFDA